MVTYLVVVAVVVLVVLAGASMRVLKEYARGVEFRLGRLRELLGPGVVLVVPGLDKLVRVDMRGVTLTIRRQGVITRDNRPGAGEGVGVSRVTDPGGSVITIGKNRRSGWW